MTATLAFEAIDHFMLADDRDSHPMTFFARLRLSGTVAESTLRRAAVRALAMHPMLRALAEGDPFGATTQLRWNVLDAADPWLDVAPAGVPPRYPAGKLRLDLTREIGVRLFLRQGAAEATLLAQFHHAAVDGVGSLRFLEDLLVTYAQLEGEKITPRPLDETLLPLRATYDLTAESKRRRRGKDLARIAAFFRKLPEPLALKRELADRPVGGEFPAFVTATLSRKEVAGLRAGGCKVTGATVNDVLLSDLFRTVAEWSGGEKSVRLAMAINMRRGEFSDLLPACNVVSMCFLDRSVAQIVDSSHLQSVVRETRDIKSHYMGYALVYIASRMGRLKGGMKLLVTPRFPWRCHASSVLSNVGRLFPDAPLRTLADGRLAAGGLAVDGCDFMPPVRPDTRAAFGVTSYRGEIQITLHYEQGLLTAVDARELLDAYVATLRTSIVDAEAEREAFRDRLQATARMRAGATAAGAPHPFRSLPIGKNVRITAEPQRLLSPAP